MTGHALWLFLAGTLLPSFAVAWMATLVMRRAAPRLGLVDQPAARKVHTTPTPLGGGVGIWLGVVLPLAAGQALLAILARGEASPGLIDLGPFEWVGPHIDGLWKRSASLWMLLAGGTALMLLGLADDRWKLDWRLRLAMQLGVAAACVASQGWKLTIFLNLPALTFALSVVWIAALINSFNMLDNMDGLSGGVAAIAAAGLAAVVLTFRDAVTGEPAPQLFVGGFLLVLVGGILGFLCHNRPPARIFMGDAGSYFVGFCIASATLLATYAGYHYSDKRHAVLAPLCVMAVPLYDMTTVLWIRLRSGKSPFEADKNHFSHRLVELGFTKGQAVLVVYLTTATCVLGALLLQRVDLLGAAIIVLLILCVLSLVALLESTARRKLKR
jgi:UDP-GlcNAc:undecaprenyl-phosphate GlcNAc-1-phosphate transferase